MGFHLAFTYLNSEHCLGLAKVTLELRKRQRRRTCGQHSFGVSVCKLAVGRRTQGSSVAARLCPEVNPSSTCEASRCSLRLSEIWHNLLPISVLVLQSKRHRAGSVCLQDDLCQNRVTPWHLYKGEPGTGRVPISVCVALNLV